MRPILEGEPVLPSQFHAAAAWTPEQRLCAALLEDAIATLRVRAIRTVQKWQTPRTEVLAWLCDTDQDWPFSFVNVCRWLDLEPDATRHAILDGKVSFHLGASRPFGGGRTR